MGITRYAKSDFLFKLISYWENIMEDCECRNWARDNIVLLTDHHPDCPKYDVEAEAKAHIEALLDGIIAWANDEDGIHDECFDAFMSAIYFIGRMDLLKKSSGVGH